MSPESKEYDGRAYEVGEDVVRVLDRKFQSLLDVEEVGPSLRKRRYDRGILGNLGEKLYAHQFPNSTHISSAISNATWDFTDIDGTTVNVRIRRPAQDRKRWTFLRSGASTADVYHFYGLDPRGLEVLAAYRVPTPEMPTKGFSVPLEGPSKWDRFRVGDWPQGVSSFVDNTDSVFLDITSLRGETVAAMSSEEVELLLQRALKFFRGEGFPFPSPLDEDQLRDALEKVRRFSPRGDFMPPDASGVSICDAYQPGRFHTKNCAADHSAFSAFHDDQRLLRALRFCLQGASPRMTSDRVRSALTALNRTPSHFRPTVAFALCRHYLPDGGTVFDPCAGWGGRLVGALAARCSYVGVEPVESTVDGLHKIASRLREARVGGGVTILHSTIEEADLVGVTADFALTSPPYVDQESYEGLEWSEYAAWRSGFLPLMFERVEEVLRPGGRFAVNIADVRRGSKTLALTRDVRETAGRLGWVEEGGWRMELGSFGGRRKDEPILVFKRVTSRWA